jgi:hypothetical protein
MTPYERATEAAITVMESFWDATLPDLNGQKFQFSPDDIKDFYSLSDALYQTPGMTLATLFKNQYEEEPPGQIKAAFGVFIATFREVIEVITAKQVDDAPTTY